MNPQSAAFETYVNSLVELGVFPSFTKLFDGWTCELRNNADKKIMPIKNGEYCWGKTITESLTSAVMGLNAAFPNPPDLHKYISTGGIPEKSFQKKDFFKP